MERKAEPELMDLHDEVEAYAKADFAEVNQRFVDRLLELSAIISSPIVRAVDLGTGPGDIPIRVAKVRPQWQIIAVDGSAPMLDVARKSTAQAGVTNIEFVLADAKDTRLSPASLDIVFSNSILHHVSDPLAFWREVKRIAKPGALIFVRDLFRPNSDSAVRKLVAQHAAGESRLLQEEFCRSLLSAYTVDEVCAQLSTADLSSLKVALVSDRHLDAWGA